MGQAAVQALSHFIHGVVLYGARRPCRQACEESLQGYFGQIMLSSQKSNFVVSAFRDIWIPRSKKIFAIDYYIRHVLEREGCLSDYVEIEVAPVSRSTRGEFIEDHDFVDHKFHQYQGLLAQRLDEVHGTSYGTTFWRKALSLGLLRHVAFCYDLFKVCENHLNVALHDCRVLDQASFIVPEDFDAHRQIFQHTDLGQEQLFSVYCRLFHPGRFSSWREVADLPNQSAKLSKPQMRASLWQLIPNRVARGVAAILDNPARVIYEIIGWFLRIRTPRVGIIDCHFSPEHRHRLAIESAGRMQTIPLPKIPSLTSIPQWNLRDLLIREISTFDRFDKFVFACLRHAMPKIFVEDFSHAYTHIDIHFDRYPALRWAVCEGWIGHTLPSLSLAVLSQRGVKHIYNEHNYLSYFFVGSNLKYLAQLTDEFVTLGWDDPSIPNLIRGASLFQWVKKDHGHNKKEHDILFICGLPMARAPEINAGYGDSGAYRALEYFDMNRRFLEGLGEDTLGKLYFRSYPSWAIRDCLTWDPAFVLAPYISKAKTYDASTSMGKLLMQRSRLVVINYVSTSYLESIIANIPTVFLWNRDTNLFTERHMGAFDTLIESGICQTNPENAATFINNIKGNPEEWWQSAAVQNSRREFLKANIGEPDVMIQYLLTKAR